jgi:hypothetical protein
MSGIFDQIINYAPPSLLLGTVTYKGTWSAATNTPTLVDPTSAITNGNYYVVDAAGTQFTLVFNIGDWIISNGSTWEKVDNTDAISSVFGRTGAVVGVSTDYSSVGITNTALGASNPSTVAATTVTATSTIAATGAVTGSNLSGTNTGDQTISLTGGVTGSGTGSFAATVVTNADLTGVITSVGNATSIASQTGTGTKFVVDTSPTLVTPNIGVATGTSLAAALNGSLGATTPSTVAATTLSASTQVDFFGRLFGLNVSNETRLYAGSAGLSIYDHIGTGRILNLTQSSTNVGVVGTGDVATFTSTGLNSTAIGATTPSTGAFSTLSATGQITSTTTGQFFLNNTPTTQANYMRLTNTSGNMYFGLEGATPVLGGTAYDTVLVGKTGLSLSGNDGGGTQLRVTSAGAAITGTLSATGLVTLQQTASSTTDVEYIKFNGSGENLGYLSWNNAFGNLARINGTKLGGGASADEGRLIFSVATNSVLSAVAEINPTGLDVTGTTTSSSDVIISSGNYLRLNNTANSGFASINFDGTNVTSNYGVAITGTLSATSTVSITGTSTAVYIGNQASGGGGATLRLAPSNTVTARLAALESK